MVWIGRIKADQFQLLLSSLTDTMLKIVTAHHLVPGSDDALHVEITRKESNDPIRNDLAVLDEDRAKVTNDRRFVSDFEARRDWHLVRASRDDQG